MNGGVTRRHQFAHLRFLSIVREGCMLHNFMFITRPEFSYSMLIYSLCYHDRIYSRLRITFESLLYFGFSIRADISRVEHVDMI